jgi:hypothetical protein
MKHLLTEAVTIQGVQLRAKSPKTGGPLLATYKGIDYTYSVDVDTVLYDGPVAIVSIWQTDSGAYKIKDNTGKVVNIKRKHIDKIVSEIKNNAETIVLTSPEADLTLTKKS